MFCKEDIFSKVKVHKLSCLNIFDHKKSFIHIKIDILSKQEFFIRNKSKILPYIFKTKDKATNLTEV